jgi:sugar lactone lactonase YvrE
LVDVLAEGLGFLEGPRWRDNKLWFSDFMSQTVNTVDTEGNVETICEVAEIPSGLGWLPDGTLLIVSMLGKKVVLQDGTTYADLSAFATNECNDMVVAADGTAYVGQFGFDYRGGASPEPTDLMRVATDGSVSVAADDLMFPNGMVITPDNETLIVGETYGARMTAFDIAKDGTLSNRRVWAPVPSGVPDGCCLDADGALWVASPVSNDVIHLREGGEATERISTGDRNAIACMLGGDDRRTLFICASVMTEEPGRGAILTTRVDAPGAGIP